MDRNRLIKILLVLFLIVLTIGIIHVIIGESGSDKDTTTSFPQGSAVILIEICYLPFLTILLTIYAIVLNNRTLKPKQKE